MRFSFNMHGWVKVSKSEGIQGLKISNQPDGGVEDTAEPDDEADDARGVHGGVLLGADDELLGHVVVGPVDVHAAVVDEDLGQVALAELVRLVGERAPGQVHDVHGDEGGLGGKSIG